LPLLLANLFVTSRGRPAWYRYAVHGAALMLTAAAAIGLGADTLPLGLRGPGLLGWTAGHWVRSTTGPWTGDALLLFTGAYALAQVVYAPHVRRVFSDARTLSGFGARQVRARVSAWWRQVRPQTGWAWYELPLLPLHGLLFAAGWTWERGIRRTLIRPLSDAVQGWRERRYSVARVKHGPAAPVAPSAAYTPEQQPRFRPAAAPPVPDAFADWLEEPAPMPPAAPAPPLAATPAVPQPRPSAPTVPPPAAPLPIDAPGGAVQGERVARWEEYLRRYKENLDLDWDERSWKRKRLEDLGRDGEEGADAGTPPSTKPT
jgi:hypothetical protein